MTWASFCTWVTRKWLWCVDPVCSHDGKPSHPKLLTWAILACFALNRPLPVVVVVALLAASFGLKAFLMFLQRGTFTGASADTTTIKVIAHEWADGKEDGIA